MRDWMLYGAYGTTGRLVLAEALRRGHRPVLAGRDAAQLAPLAAATGLPWRALTLQDPAALAGALTGRALVLNAAGPFAETGPALIEACLAAGVCYADLSGEVHHLRAVLGQDARARAAGVALLTGAGFATSYGEALARYALARMPGAVALRLSVAAANRPSSPGARRSIIEVLARGGLAVAGGQIRPRPLAHRRWRVGAMPFAAVPLGELAAVHSWADLPEITTGRPMPAGAARALRLLSPLLRLVLRWPAVRRAAGRSRRTPDEPAQGDPRSRIWAELLDAAGRRRVFCLETGEGYAATAAAALATVEALLEAPDLRGAYTPGGAFGTDLITRLGDVQIDEL